MSDEEVSLPTVSVRNGYRVNHAVVTGGTGFMGGALVRLLVREGWSVTVIHRTETSLTALEALRTIGVATVAFRDHTDVQSIVRSLTPNAVFHLAAHQAREYRSAEVNHFIDSNIALGTNLLEGLTAVDCVVVNAMSYSQFRRNQPVVNSLYTATKQAYLEIAEFYRVRVGMDVRNMVLFDNYGPYDPRDKLVPHLVDSLANGNRALVGPLDQKLNLLHVDDVAAGLLASLGVGNPSMMRVSSSELCTVGDVIHLLEEITDAALEFSIDDSRTISDQALESGDWPLPRGWHPRTALREGLEATFRSHLRG